MAKRPITIKWTGKKQFVGTDSGKHSIVISAHNEDNHTGMKPSELMLLSLGACSAYDVVDIIGKKRITLEDMRIEISSEQDHIRNKPSGSGRKQRVAVEFTSLMLALEFLSRK